MAQLTTKPTADWGFTITAATLSHRMVSEGKYVWDVVGRVPGNYAVSITSADGPKRYDSLWLEVVDPRHRVKLVSLKANHGIGAPALTALLDHCANLNCWGTAVPCRLVAITNGKESVSRPGTLRAPVEPWQAPIDPDLFASDPTIRYCQATTGEFIGRDLTRHGRFLCFTYRDVLETDPTLRGFACIGFVAVVLGVPHSTGAAGDSAKLAEHLHGQAFDWPERPKTGVLFEQVNKNSVHIGAKLMAQYLSTPAGRSADHMIWIKGHAGLVRKGIVYECAPPNHGFTHRNYTPGSESSVASYTPEQFMSGVKAHALFMSRIPANNAKELLKR